MGQSDERNSGNLTGGLTREYDFYLGKLREAISSGDQQLEDQIMDKLDVIWYKMDHSEKAQFL